MNYTKHIVLLTPGFAENEADTACTPYLQDYFQALQKAHPDWRLSIVAIQYPYKPGGYTWKGIEVQTIGGKNRRWNRFATWRKTKRIVQVLNRLQKIDVIHSFWLREAALIGNSLSQKLGIRHVATAMGQDIHPENKYLKRLNAPQTTFACLTESAATTLSKHFPKDQIQLFHWGLAQADFPARLSKNRDIDILAVGSLISLKRHDRLLRAVRALKDRFPNLRVVLVGEGEFRPKIEQHLSELGLEAQLELKGQLPREDVLNLMRRAKVFFSFK